MGLVGNVGRGAGVTCFWASTRTRFENWRDDVIIELGEKMLENEDPIRVIVNKVKIVTTRHIVAKVVDDDEYLLLLFADDEKKLMRRVFILVFIICS